MRVLVVEDEPDIRELFLTYIEPYGRGDAVANGLDALDAIGDALTQRDPYGIVLLDIMMPKMGGREALAGIRELELEHNIHPGQGAKVIMTTALGDPDSVLGSFRDQCDGYIIKPVTRDNLLDGLRDAGLIV